MKMETEAILQCTICKCEIQTPYKITYRNRYVCSAQCWNLYKKMAMFVHKILTEIIKYYPPPDEQSREILREFQEECDWIKRQEGQVYVR